MNEFEILLKQDSNKRNFQLLQDSIENVVPYLGAGASMGYGYMGWVQFLKKCHGDLEKSLARGDTSSIDHKNIRRIQEKIKDNELIDAAELIDMELNNNIADKIDLTFGKHTLDDKNISEGLLPAIFAFGFEILATTNYDHLIEEIHLQNEVDYENITKHNLVLLNRKLKKDKSADKVLVLKVHGTSNDCKTHVLTKTQYDNAYGERLDKNLELPQAIMNLWKQRTLLFVGCSMFKDRTIELFNDIAGHDSLNYHYAIIETPNTENKKNELRKTLDRCKIRPIWYPNGKHECVELIIKKLKECKIRSHKKDVYIGKQKHDGKTCPETKTDGPPELLKTISINHIDDLVKVSRGNQTKLGNLFVAVRSFINEKNNLSVEKYAKRILDHSRDTHFIARGLQGTGKSTFLSIIYLELLKKYNSGSSNTFPVYFDLHKFNSSSELSFSLETIINAKSQIDFEILLFIDGRDQFYKNVLYESNYKRVNKFLKNNKDIKIIAGISDISSDVVNRRASEDFLVNRKSKKLEFKYADVESSEIRDIISKMIRILPFPKMDKAKKNNYIDHIWNMLRKTANKQISFRTMYTIIDIVKGKQLKEIEELNHCKVLKDYISENANDDLYEVAKATVKYCMVKRKDWKNYEEGFEFLIFKGEPVRAYLAAYYYVESIENNLGYENIKVFDGIFTSIIDRFVIYEMNDQNRNKDKLYNGIKKFLNDKKVSCNTKAQLAYYLGRLSGENLKRKEIRLLKSHCEIVRNEIYSNANSLLHSDVYVFYRSINISLIHLGCYTFAERYFEEISTNSKLADISRTFHMEYYSTQKRDFFINKEFENYKYDETSVKKVFDIVYNSIGSIYKTDDTDMRGMLYLSILNLISYYVYYEIENKIELVNKDDFDELLSKLQTCEILKSSTINSVIEITRLRIKDNHFNPYKEILKELYNMKAFKRDGWKKRNIDEKENESIADHSFGCAILAMIFLPENLNFCSFAFENSDDEYKGYDKSKIINLLFTHDLAKSKVGDKVKNEQNKEYFRKMDERFAYYALLDKCRYFNSFSAIKSNWLEYKDKNSINSKIANDINAIEPFVQYNMYFGMLEEKQGREVTEDDYAAWEKEIFKEIDTSLCESIFKLIKEVFDHNKNSIENHQERFNV